jgi:Kdo2-lipid IVA lauroyltransferase/acyltransferase
MNTKSLFLANPKYWPAWLCLGILWLITRLPYRIQIKIGEALGKLLHLFPTKLKHTTEINIKLCLPELNPKQHAALIKKNFAALGVGLIEAAMAWWLPDEKLSAVVKVHGYEHVEAAFAKGKGIILLGPHFTCLEMIGRLLGMQYKFAVMYRPHKKPLISFIHERFRAKKSIQYIPRQKLRELLRALNNNTAIWYAYDVDGGKKRSVFAPFFGIQTASLTAVSRIVQMSNSTVIPISFYRRDNEFGYDIFLQPPIENFPGKDFTEDATRLNQTLENAIRAKPEQYVWQYKRFKTRPEGEKRFY